MENEVLAIYYLSKEFTASYNNYLAIRYNIQRATKKAPALYARDDMRGARDVALATWKKLKRAVRTANEYKQL